jgi:UMF1 family MFS transporter
MFRNWNRTELSWAFYDWANSVYALIVITAFFPVFLGYHIDIACDHGSIRDTCNTTSVLGFANSAASLAVVLLAPIFGALGDQYGARRKLLAAFAALGILATAALALVERGQPMLAAFVFACGNIGFYVANGLYDSLLVSVTARDKLDRLSALGFALGYLGSLLLFVLGLAMTLKPDWFGFEDAIAAMRAMFLISALWWLLFTIPLLVVTLNETWPIGNPEGSAWRQVRAAFVELGDTLREIHQYRNAAIFLLAYFFYMDGVYTVIKMAVVYADARGFDPMVPMIGIVIVQVIAIPATLAYGRLAGRFGARRMILIGVFAYLLVTGGAPFMSRPEHFYALALVIGLAQGGLQSISRSLFARLIPESEPGKYFGFYNMLGKLSAVLGPFLMAVMAPLIGERYSIVAIPVLLIVGMVLLLFVNDAD